LIIGVAIVLGAMGVSLSFIYAVPQAEKPVVAVLFDGKAHENPRGISKQEFQLSGTYIVPEGAKNIKITLSRLESYDIEKQSGVFSTYETSVDTANKRWKIIFKTNYELQWVSPSIDYEIDGQKFSTTRCEMRLASTKSE
jgi:hypothetical protein